MVLPQIVAAKAPGEPVRICVPGCSTGEEVYFIAICLLEHLGDRASDTPIQIFATDISDEAIKKARSRVHGRRDAGGSVSSPEPMEVMQSIWPSASFACLPATT
jgi:two-component system, chemotaxis family, CheB/CheR fusion protein